jgi:hypothetical protein
MGMIQIKCKTQDYLELDDLTDFQGTLKKRSESDVLKLQDSILKHGFAFPFFTWRDKGYNWVLDGHGRTGALKGLRDKGEQIPLLPVVYIEAAGVAQAKELLLKLNSRYGTITEQGFTDFVSDLPELDMDELGLQELDFSSFDYPIEKQQIELKPYKREHYLISVDIGKIDTIIELIETIRNIEGVEVENGNN